MSGTRWPVIASLRWASGESGWSFIFCAATVSAYLIDLDLLIVLWPSFYQQERLYWEMNESILYCIFNRIKCVMCTKYIYCWYRKYMYWYSKCHHCVPNEKRVIKFICTIETRVCFKSPLRIRWKDSPFLFHLCCQQQLLLSTPWRNSWQQPHSHEDRTLLRIPRLRGLFRW